MVGSGGGHVGGWGMCGTEYVAGGCMAGERGYMAGERGCMAGERGCMAGGAWQGVHGRGVCMRGMRDRHCSS